MASWCVCSFYRIHFTYRSIALVPKLVSHLTPCYGVRSSIHSSNARPSCFLSVRFFLHLWQSVHGENWKTFMVTYFSFGNSFLDQSKRINKVWSDRDEVGSTQMSWPVTRVQPKWYFSINYHLLFVVFVCWCSSSFTLWYELRPAKRR